MHKITQWKSVKRPDPDVCEYDGCRHHPMWEIRNCINSSRMSCDRHVTQLLEPGVANMLIPVDAMERVAPLTQRLAA